MATYDVKQIALPGGDIANLKDGNAIHKSNTSGFVKNDGSIDQNTYQIAQEGKGLSTNDYTTAEKNKVATIDNKADKVSSATNGNLAGLNGSGNPTDSGISGDMTTTSASGNPISIADLKSAQIALNPVITFEPIQAGSGTPSPSNIRAISGYDKIEVLSCGFNVFNETWEDGTFNTSTGQKQPSSSGVHRSAEYFALSPNTDYYIKVPGTGASYIASIWYYDANKNFIRFNSFYPNGVILTTPSNACFGMIDIASTYGATYNHDICINVSDPNLNGRYVPYHKTTDLSESLGQTVYGLDWDVRTGKAKNRLKAVDMGTLPWTYYSSSTRSFFYTVISDVGTATPDNSLCEIYPIVIDAVDKSMLWNGTQIRVFDYSYTDATAFTNSVNGKKLVYPVATPTEIQLTPHEIALSQGYNYISTNGTSISMAYHNGELTSLADVSQLGETLNELGEYVEYYTGKNKSGTAVSINAYTSSSNMYTCPSDGYLVISSGSSTSGKLRAVVRGSNNSNIAFLYMNVVGDYQIQSLFVRKGMYVYLQENSVGNGSAEFHPIE